MKHFFKFADVNFLLCFYGTFSVKLAAAHIINCISNDSWLKFRSVQLYQVFSLF